MTGHSSPMCSGEKIYRGRCLECGEQVEPAPEHDGPLPSAVVADSAAARGWVGELFEAKASAADVAAVIAQVGEIAGAVSGLLTLPADVSSIGGRVTALEFAGWLRDTVNLRLASLEERLSVVEGLVDAHLAAGEPAATEGAADDGAVTVGDADGAGSGA